MDILFAAFMFILPVAVVLLLEKQRYKAAGCVLAIAGAGWACLWGHDRGDAPLMVPIGILGAIVGALIYLHGVKRDILSHMEKQKEDILQAIEKATTGATERTNTESGKREEGA
ncbi:MAG: hypothetical protein FJ290_01750 [Planctomycetes bacterium]|nr:hypothetical protein [Planctomycetota bacterium]